MGAEPGGAPLRPKAPLWVDGWLGGRVAKRSPKFCTRERENVKMQNENLKANTRTDNLSWTRCTSGRFGRFGRFGRWKVRIALF